jgi:cation:H+ antiporter
MELMLLSLFTLALSFPLVYLGAKTTLLGALCLSHRLFFDKVVVGSVFVASITVMPELFSSLQAALIGSSNLALGSILGSNIYNVPLLIGICGLLREFRISNSPFVEECLFLLISSGLLLIILFVTGNVSFWVGAIFLAIFPLFVYRFIRKTSNHSSLNQVTHDLILKRTALYLVIGGLLLLCGTFLLVNGALGITVSAGVSEFYAGSLIIAMGCIVPEVSVSLLAMRNREQDISLGNIIGDNILTITLVFGLVGIIRPFSISIVEVLTTLPFTILIISLVMYIGKTHRKITKPISVAMLAIAIISFTFQLFFI